MLEKNYKLDHDIYHLLKDEPFFALLSRQLDKRCDNSIPTAGMRFNPDRLVFELIYNSDFMKELSPVHKKWVLMHELYHASLGHTQFRKLGELNRMMANCAMDLAINSLSNMKDNAPDFVLMPGRGDFVDIVLFGQSAEWYANQIKKEQEKDPDKFEGGEGQFDDHSEFGEASATDVGKQIAEKKLQDQFLIKRRR